MRTESHPFTKSNNCLTCHQIHSEKAKCTEWRDLCMPVWTKRCYLNNSGTNISTVENIKESLRFLRRYFFLSVHLILYSWPMKIVWLWRLWCDSPLMASEASPSQQCQNHQISTSNSFFLGKESSSFLREKGNCLWCLNSNPIPGDPKLILISFRKEVTFHQNWDFFTQFPTLCGNVITTYQFQEVLKE